MSQAIFQYFWGDSWTHGLVHHKLSLLSRQSDSHSPVNLILAFMLRGLIPRGSCISKEANQPHGDDLMKTGSECRSPRGSTHTVFSIWLLPVVPSESRQGLAVHKAREKERIAIHWGSFFWLFPSSEVFLENVKSLATIIKHRYLVFFVM